METKFGAIKSSLCRSEDKWSTVGWALTQVLQEGVTTEILTHLDTLIQEKENSIQELCSQNQKTLLKGLQVANKLRDTYKTTREDIVYLSSGVQEVANFVSQSYSELVPSQKKLELLEQALNYIYDMTSALQLIKKAQTQILSLKPLSALRTLSKAKGLQVLQQSTPSTQVLRNFVPKLEEMVEQQMEEKLSDWLVSTRKVAESLGKNLLNQALSWLNFERQKKNKHKVPFKSRESVLNSLSIVEKVSADHKTSRELNSYTLTRLSSMRESSRLTHSRSRVSDFQLMSVNYSSLLNFEGVFEMLDKGKDFREKLKLDRRLQVLQTPTFYEEFKTKFEALIGQLFIEKELCEQDERLRSEEELQGLWIETIVSLEKTVQDAFNTLKSPQKALELKNSVILFVNAANKIGFTHRSYQLSHIVRDNHERTKQILLEDFNNKAARTIEQEEYRPLTLETLGNRNLEEIGLNDESEEKGSYSFTPAVPDLGTLVKDYVWMDLEYLEDISENPGEELFKTIQCLVRDVNSLIFDQVKSSTVLQTAILAVNATYLYKTFSYICHFFEGVVSYSRDYSTRGAFMELKEHCERSIFEKVQEQVSTYLDMITNLNPQAIQKHHWVSDMLSYVENTSESLQKLLGPQISSTSLLATFQFVSSHLIELLASSQKFNFNLLVELSKDLKEIEDFIKNSASCSSIPGLADSLSEIKQLLSLFLTNDLEILLDQKKRETKYPRLNISYITPILERYREVKGQPPKQKTALNIAKKLKLA